jgi:hypothetical protein
MLNHSRSSPYLVQYFKQPLQAPCGCKACRKGMWSSFILKDLAPTFPHSWQVPLPIPLPVEVGQAMHYMPLDAAMNVQLDDSHQPSMVNGRQRRSGPTKPGGPPPHPRAQEIYGQQVGNKTIARQFARGVVTCKDCGKPRMIYSPTAPGRMVPPIVGGVIPTPEQVAQCQGMAKEVLQEVSSLETYVCGASLLDLDHSFHGVFIAQATLTCSDPVEPFYYTCPPSSRSGFSANLCCFCALNEALTLDEELKGLFRTVLPVCSTCIGKGAKIPVRQRINNAEALATRVALQAARASRGRGRGRGRNAP